MLFVVSGIALALLNGGAEYFYSQGFKTASLDKLYLSARLFPWDFKYRNGPAEFAAGLDDAAVAVRVLSQAQITEPYSAALAFWLMNHMIRIGDHEGASQQFARLYRLAPNSEIVKQLLARRRDP